MLHLQIHIATLAYDTNFTITKVSTASEPERHSVDPGTSDSPTWEAAGFTPSGGGAPVSASDARGLLWAAYYTRPGTCTVIVDIPAGIANPSACIGATVTLWAGVSFVSALYSLSFTCTEASSAGRLVLVSNHTESSAIPFVRTTETVPGEAAQEGDFYLHKYGWNGGSPPATITHQIIGQGYPHNNARPDSWLPLVAADSFGRPDPDWQGMTITAGWTPIYSGPCPFPTGSGETGGTFDPSKIYGQAHSYRWGKERVFNSEWLEGPASGFQTMPAEETAYRTSKGESWWTDYPDYIPIGWSPNTTTVLSGEARTYQVTLSAYDAPPAPRQWVTIPRETALIGGDATLSSVPGYVLTTRVEPNGEGFTCYVLVYVHSDRTPYTPMQTTKRQRRQIIGKGLSEYLSGTFTPYTAPTVSPVTL